MSAITHLSIDLFPAMMLIIIFINNKKRAVRNTDKYWFKILNVSMIVYLMVDIVYWGGAGLSKFVPEEHIWGFNMCYQILVGVSVCSWFNYVYCRLHLEIVHKKNRWMLHLANTIFVGYIGLIITTPWTGLMFSLGENNQIVRGPLFRWQYLLCIGMVMWAAVLTIWHRIHENSKDVREECTYLIIFNLISLGGVLIQGFVSRWWIASPCVALSIFLIYVTTQNRQITTDSLTGLNNRREFDQYIHKRIEQKKDSGWGMLMLDLDDFKEVNDQYGHKVGDEALWNTAEILRTVLGKDGNFLARYGGDEFVVIGEWNNEEEVWDVIRALQQEAERFNQNRKSWPLYYSIGYALWSENPSGSIDAFIEKADERMYMEKIEKKKRKIPVAR